jgi:hypothetical protein
MNGFFEESEQRRTDEDGSFAFVRPKGRIEDEALWRWDGQGEDRWMGRSSLLDGWMDGVLREDTVTKGKTNRRGQIVRSRWA